MFDSLITRFRDVVFGRPRIHVVTDSGNEKSSIKPIFIIGTFRSGTTLLRFLLNSHSRVCCPPETKFLIHLAAMHKDESAMRALKHMGFEKTFLKMKIQEFVNSFYKIYMQANNKVVFIDKTPDYVRILDFIDWLYDGKCKYIVIFRNGLDVTQSMNSTIIEPLEPSKTIYSAFEYWHKDTTIMLEWLSKHPERCFKLTYEELCDNTKFVMADVLSFIGEKWEEGILKWYSKRHDRGFEDINARRQRKINKSVQTYRDWDPEVIRKLKQKAYSLHCKIGYDPSLLQ